MSEITSISSFYPSSLPSMAAPFLHRSTHAESGEKMESSGVPAVSPFTFHGPELSSYRAARARAIREQIEDGTYETRERISGTVERLLDVIA